MRSISLMPPAGRTEGRGHSGAPRPPLRQSEAALASRRREWRTRNPEPRARSKQPWIPDRRAGRAASGMTPGPADTLNRLRQRLVRARHHADRVGIRCARVLLPLAEQFRIVDDHLAARVTARRE